MILSSLLTFIGLWLIISFLTLGLAVFWLTFALTIDGAMAAGYNVNALELSPNYAGSIRAMASTIANIQGFLAPTIIALIIEDNVTPFFLE